MTSLLNPFFGAGDLDLVAGVFRAGDLDLSGSFELKVLQLLSTFADDKAVMLLGNSHRCGSLKQRSSSEVKNYKLVGRKDSSINVKAGYQFNR